ncbi:hypothetical protein [Streptomyces sp. MST-110588]|uniref:hypothetical protein n=1 Tax=Streptomyces sp. MST-110588 TaxID=2833628 RepID=UPI001F5E140A|nr:hypothetical protein [Streptomyces sp. MST-110588]UNO41158.1 hypothetical protein KGS77_18165 [Streptomyces sp. MST-110588]
MTTAHEDTPKQQADITRLLLRGVLPAPASAEAVRVVTGAGGTTATTARLSPCTG